KGVPDLISLRPAPRAFRTTPYPSLAAAALASPFTFFNLFTHQGAVWQHLCSTLGQNQESDSRERISSITLPRRLCMRFKTIEDVLAWTGVFHDHLAGEYQRLSERGEQQRLDLLLKYLADHERLLQRSVERFRDDAPERLRNTWFDMAPEVPLPGT